MDRNRFDSVGDMMLYLACKSVVNEYPHRDDGDTCLHCECKSAIEIYDSHYPGGGAADSER